MLAASNEHKKEVDNTKRPLLKKIKGEVLNEDDGFYGQNKDAQKIAKHFSLSFFESSRF